MSDDDSARSEHAQQGGQALDLENDELFNPENTELLKLIKINDQVRRLQTIIRDINTTRSEFVISSDRLIRLVIEEGLNFLPCSQHTVITPSGQVYEGVKFDKGNCGVSIIRSGEAMERALRDSCRSIRIGKILIQSDEETNQAKLFYAKLPKDVSQRNVLLMYPILCGLLLGPPDSNVAFLLENLSLAVTTVDVTCASGSTVLKAIEVLKEYGVADSKIILLTLFCTPQGVDAVSTKYPGITLLSSEVHTVAPVHFGQKYFGTE